MISFTSRLTPRSYFRLLVSSVLGSPASLVLGGAAVVLSVGYVFWTFVRTCGGMRVAIVFAVVTALVVPAFIALVLLVAAAAQVLLGRNRNLYEPVDVDADAEGISTKSALGHGTIDWRAFTRVRRVAGYVLLYQTSRAFLALGGKDADAATLDAFYALARERTAAVR